MEAVTTPPRAEGLRKTLLTCAATAALALLLGAAGVRIWRLDLRVPFTYCHDALPVLMWTKSVADTGWWMTNDHLGAPGRMEMADYPTNPNLHMAAIKVLTLVSSQPAVLVNLYFLLSFPLVALGALAALRALGLSRLGAMVAAVLYALLPYHFWRGEAHLYLSCYYMVPLAVLVVAWVWRDTPFLVVRRPSGRLGLEVKSWRALGSLLICTAIGFDSTYYPLFAGFFILCAGLLTYSMKGSACTLWRTAVLVGTVAAVLAANLATTFVYRQQHGPNTSELLVTQRPWTDVELYSLKVVQMMLPAPEHPIRFLRAIRDKYYAPAPLGTPLPSEGDSMALGTLGTLGLLLLLARLFLLSRVATERGQLHALLSVLTVLAILVGTTGGLVTIVNLTFFTMGRCFNRLSIFIALFALAALFAALDDLRQRWAATGWRAWAAGTGLLCLVPLGFVDQTGINYFANFSTAQADFQSDQAFVGQTEAAVPPGTQIFQLPYISFLSYVNDAGHMGPYSHFRGYIHSRTLKWSFGAMHGRPTDQLHAQLGGMPMPRLLESLAYLGFGGIYVDRFGYADNGAQVEADLRKLLGIAPIVSGNSRLAFYDTSGYVRKLRGSCSDEEWSSRQHLILAMPLLEWKRGFFAEERGDGKRWRWCGETGELQVMVPGDRGEKARLKFVGVTCDPGDAELVIEGPSFADKITVNTRGRQYEQVIELPPGQHVLRFRCNARPFVDPRTLVFALYNFELIPVSGN
jgi:phosphoglycerol transferase